MEIAALYEKLPCYDFPEVLERQLRAYLQELIRREDLVALAQSYYDDIFTKNAYTPAEIEGLSEQDGREEGMLFAVIFLARYEQLDLVLAKRGIPASYKAGALQTYRELMVKNYNCYGSYGFRGMYRSGLVPYLTPKKYIIGRLCFEVTKFLGVYTVYRNKKDGTTIPVAQPGVGYMPNGKRPGGDYTGELIEPYFQQDPQETRCYAFADSGRLCTAPITFSTADYAVALKPGDDVLSVHIPAHGKMTPELVDEAFARAEAFFATYYPEMKFAAYVCSSWLLNTDLREILPEESNIIQFQSRFRVVLTGVNGYSLYWHIFGVEHFVSPAELVPINRFQQTLRNWVISGNNLYNGYGYILKNEKTGQFL